MKHKSLTYSLLLCSFIVTACASSGANDASKAQTTQNHQSSSRPAQDSEEIAKAMKTALARAEANGDEKGTLNALAQIHAHTPDDVLLATRYARALRESDQTEKAQKTLRPFVDTSEPNVRALTEMAMIQLSLGDYTNAKDYALKSTELNPKNARGYLALGTAQDALQDHQNAEQSFRRGLKNWQGDPSPILNNLALNLASQGHTKESLSLLERALKISPKRLELERNRRIIATLLETENPLTSTTQQQKPDIVIPDTAKPTKKPQT